MNEEAFAPWVHGSNEDIISTIAYALCHEGKRATRQADQLIAQAAAARILAAMKWAYTITPKAPAPLTRADQLPKGIVTVTGGRQWLGSG